MRATSKGNQFPCRIVVPSSSIADNRSLWSHSRMNASVCLGGHDHSCRIGSDGSGVVKRSRRADAVGVDMSLSPTVAVARWVEVSVVCIAGEGAEKDNYPRIVEGGDT